MSAGQINGQLAEQEKPKIALCVHGRTMPHNYILSKRVRLCSGPVRPQ